jgi:hypothetical protein
MHLVPDNVQSVAKNLQTDFPDIAINSVVRLEAIRDYCEHVLSEYEAKNH